jgi:hypothetical protein
MKGSALRILVILTTLNALINLKDFKELNIFELE